MKGRRGRATLAAGLVTLLLLQPQRSRSSVSEQQGGTSGAAVLAGMLSAARQGDVGRRHPS